MIMEHGNLNTQETANSDLGAVMRWRDLRYEMPPEHENVLVKLDGDTYLMGVMDSNNEWGIYWSDGRNVEDPDRPVTHWMPIPAFPQPPHPYNPTP
jgi:hypothetical protein